MSAKNVPSPVYDALLVHIAESTSDDGRVEATAWLAKMLLLLQNREQLQCERVLKASKIMCIGRSVGKSITRLAKKQVRIPTS